MLPLVTIIIPTYNRENIISETIECAVNQTYSNIEIIVVDNCSTDNTYEILQGYSNKYSNIKLFQNKTNLGPVRNWEIALSKATGKYTKILWSDDKITKDFVEKTVPILENDSDVGFVYSKTLVFGSNWSKEYYRFSDTGAYPISDFVNAHLGYPISVPVSPGCAIFRTDDLVENLIVDIENPKKLDFSRYGAGNDLLLFLFTAVKYKYFYFIDETLSFFRSHEKSLTISNNLNEYYLYAKHYFIKTDPNFVERNAKDLFYSQIFFKNQSLRYICDSVQFNKINGALLIVKKLFKKIKSAI